MLFVIEGPDYAGKTTFTTALSNLLSRHDPSVDVLVTHAVPPTPEESMDLAQNYYAKASEAHAERHVIFDRLHVGELVYGPIFRAGSLITMADKTAIDNLLVSRSAELIYLNPGEDELRRRINAGRGDDLVANEHQLMNISRMYDQLLLDDLNWRHVKDAQKELEQIEIRLMH